MQVRNQDPIATKWSATHLKRIPYSLHNKESGIQSLQVFSSSSMHDHRDLPLERYAHLLCASNPLFLEPPESRRVFNQGAYDYRCMRPLCDAQWLCLLMILSRAKWVSVG
jgi:hypothetical protein